MRSSRSRPRSPVRPALLTICTSPPPSWRVRSGGQFHSHRLARHPPFVEPAATPDVNTQTLISLLGGVWLALGLSACNSSSGSASAATNDASAKTQRSDTAAGRGGRQAPTSTLAPGDPALAGRATSEAGTPTTRHLKPSATGQ